MDKKSYHVLFICHDNAGRSLMAEAMLNHLGHNRFRAFSAGTHPTEVAHPAAIEVLKKEGFETQDLKPKHINEFHENDAPQMDMVISLCENSKGDSEFLNWEGEPVTAHWHFEEPHKNEADTNTDEYQKELHRYAMIQRELSSRIRLLLNLPDEKLNNMMLHH